jgi:hypothetical protein
MYHLMLTDQEVSSLAWFADRGYFPAEIYDAMGLADGELDPDDPKDVPRDLERKWEFPEHAAWSLSELRETDGQPNDSYLSCMSGELLTKVQQLESEIV